MKRKLRNAYVNYVFMPILGLCGLLSAATFAVLFFPTRWMYNAREFDLILFRLSNLEFAKSLKSVKDLKHLFDVDGANGL